MALTHMSWKRRLAVVLSAVWIIVVAAIAANSGAEHDIRDRYFFNASHALTLFLVFGVLPLLVLWGSAWVLSAKRSGENRAK